jgi:hypothetical protein
LNSKVFIVSRELVRLDDKETDSDKLFAASGVKSFMNREHQQRLEMTSLNMVHPVTIHAPSD